MEVRLHKWLNFLVYLFFNSLDYTGKLLLLFIIK